MLDASTSRLAAQRVRLAVSQLPKELGASASRPQHAGLRGWGPAPRGASACSLAVAAVLVSLAKVAAGVCGGAASALPISVSVRARLPIWERERRKRGDKEREGECMKG